MFSIKKIYIDFVERCKIVPHLCVVIFVLVACHDAKLDFIKESTTWTMVTMCIITIVIASILFRWTQIAAAAYLFSSLFINYVLVNIAVDIYKNKHPISASKENIIFLIALFILFVLTIFFGMTYSYLDDEGCGKFAVLKTVLARIVATILYGYGILVADWLRYDRYFEENPLTLPVFKWQDIIALPEKWILLTIWIIITAISVFRDIKHDRYS